MWSTCADDLTLSIRLSTIQENFTFTSLAGIQKAYQIIFPESQGVSEALRRPDLVQLEASRHLVVHNSGLVDNEYIRKTKSNLKEGEELPITDRQVLDFCNTTLEICVVLLSASESLIGRNIQE